MDDAVMQQHIDLYVNEFSVSLGIKGKQAINLMFDYALTAGIIARMPEQVFASGVV
jgi:1,4-dihydroxy-6-naphthoate synthase